MSVVAEDKKVKQSYKHVGTRPVRHDGLEKINGKARFAADIIKPRMIHGHVLRSPHAHAKILSIDTTEAEAMPGVKAVVTASDFPLPKKDEGFPHRPKNLIARDKVRYEGQTVAAVAATTRRQAREAAAKIIVNYEELPAVMTIDEAMAEDAPLVHEDLITKGIDPKEAKPSNIAESNFYEYGDIDVGFKEADFIFEHEFSTEAFHQGYIEPHACLADTGKDGRSEIWCSSQGHFMVRSATANMLDWDTSRIKVIPAEIGGGFGGKTTIYLEPLAVKLSEKADRPVKMVMSRDEVFKATGPSPGTKIRVKIGAKKSGEITAGKAWVAYQSGAFPGPWAKLGGWCIFACYNIPNVQIESHDILVNRPVNIAYRAPSAPMAAYPTETVLDQIAKEIDMDPIDFRILNAVKEGDIQLGDSVATTGNYPRIGLKDTLEAIKNHPNYKIPLGPNQGRGVATGYWFNIAQSSSATINLSEDGRAVVMTGSPDIGGSRASMAIMAAEVIGIDVNLIQPVVGDTEAVGFTDITEGSRATYATGIAVVNAAEKIVRKLKERASIMWDCNLEDVEWSDGRAIHKNGKEAPMTLPEITSEAKKTGGPLNATGSLETKGQGPAFSTQMCDLEVDPETGRVTILRYTTAQDAGTAIHPSYVEGQMQGGVAQGIGMALNEEYIYDQKGKMENPGFLDYRMPVASDLPMIDTIIVEVPNPQHPFGVRGVGEVGIVPPLPAVANAIHDAVGVRLREAPMSPVKVLKALNQKNGADL